jgi:hypothetical protein
MTPHSYVSHLKQPCKGSLEAFYDALLKGRVIKKSLQKLVKVARYEESVNGRSTVRIFEKPGIPTLLASDSRILNAEAVDSPHSYIYIYNILLVYRFQHRYGCWQGG